MAGRDPVNGLPEWIDVAVITAPHGVRGDVRVRLLTDFPDRLSEPQEVRVMGPDAQVRSATVRLSSWHGDKGVLQITGIASRTEAEALRGCRVQIPRGRCQPLPAGHYYIFELVGMEVYDQSGKYLGKVDDVIRLPANDVYVVCGPEGAAVMVPALRSVVREVDVPHRRLLVDLPPGLAD